jgi:hypothetical protein
MMDIPELECAREYLRELKRVLTPPMYLDDEFLKKYSVIPVGRDMGSLLIMPKGLLRRKDKATPGRIAGGFFFTVYGTRNTYRKFLFEDGDGVRDMDVERRNGDVIFMMHDERDGRYTLYGFEKEFAEAAQKRIPGFMPSGNG